MSGDIAGAAGTADAQCSVEVTMRRFSIAVSAVIVFATSAGGQTLPEQRAISREFERTVFTAMERFDCESGQAVPSDAIFTVPVSMVFRQLLATALGRPYAPGINAPRRPDAGRLAECEPFPLSESSRVPPAVTAVLPVLPAALEYRFVGRDLVLRETRRNVVFGVLLDAIYDSRRMTQ
jgi:hypothetical protein